MYTFWKKNLFRFYDKKIGKRHYDQSVTNGCWPDLSTLTF